MKHLWLDTECRSAVDLKTAATHRYAAEAEITIAQWSVNDDERIVVEDLVDVETGGVRWPSTELRELLADPEVIVIAHNSAFDRTLIRTCWGIEVPVHRWRDTMVQSMLHSLPGSLDKLGPILGLPVDKQKDKRGAQLIQLFCKPNKKTGRYNDRTTHPVEWAEFLEYSRQDIVTMREIHHRLPNWNSYECSRELALWHLDQKINDIGFAVDLDLARAAIAATDREQKVLKKRISEATAGEVESATQRDELLAYIVAEYGLTLPDMKKDTLKKLLESNELPEEVKNLIEIRLEATKTTTSKFRALVRATSADSRLRNSLQFAGALRTSRWAGRIFQPQNLMRPTMEFHEIVQAIEAIKSDCVDLFYDNVMDVIANTVRGAIVAGEGKKLVVADLANIEGRKLAWLAGEAWKLQAFRDYDTILGYKPDGKPIRKGPDLYNLAYARAFNIAVEDMPPEGRQIGKVMELGLGFGGGVAAFLTFAAVYKMDLVELSDAVYRTASPEVLADAHGMYEWALDKGRAYGLPERVYVACEVLKALWRNAHPATVALWSGLEQAVRRAIDNPGQTFDVRDLRVHVDTDVHGLTWLRIRLPSGRFLCYLDPKIVGRDITYMGVNQYTRQWNRLRTYGGKLVENVTQASARDVLAENMPTINDSMPIVLTVHDEILTECPDLPEYHAPRLCELMSRVPAWADGLPLSAAGFETYRYKKD